MDEMKKMNIMPGFQIRGLSLYIQKHDSYVISDLQIGYEQDLISRGVMLPKTSLSDMKKEIGNIVKGRHSKIIIDGDIKHDFGKINEQEWREVLALIDFLASHFDEIIFVKGNHDLVLMPIARKRNISVVDSLILGDIMIMHGDKVLDIPKDVKTIVIGHEHPSVTIGDGIRHEKFKCFLKGNNEGRKIIVIPSFNRLTFGSDICFQKTLSPYLSDISDFEVFIVEGDESLYFGKLGELSSKIQMIDR